MLMSKIGTPNFMGLFGMERNPSSLHYALINSTQINTDKADEHRFNIK